MIFSKNNILIALALGCLALTPAERKIASHARTELESAIQGQTAARAEADQAKQAITDANASAQLADQRAVTAEAQAKKEHEELQRAANENAKMRSIVKKVQSYWGIGGILYGFGRLATHLLILVAVVIVIAVLVGIFVPAAKPLFGIVTSFFSMIWNRFIAIFKSKPKV